MSRQLAWPKFPGVVAMTTKGCVFPTAYEQTIILLTKLIDVTHINIVDPHNNGRNNDINGFKYNYYTAIALIICAVLPYLLLRYDNPNSNCIRTAEVLAQYCGDKLEKLMS